MKIDTWSRDRGAGASALLLTSIARGVPRIGVMRCWRLLRSVARPPAPSAINPFAGMIALQHKRHRSPNLMPLFLVRRCLSIGGW